MSTAPFLHSSFLQAINAVTLWPVHVQNVNCPQPHLEVLPVLSPALPGSTTCIVPSLTWKYYLYCPQPHLEVLPVFTKPYLEVLPVFTKPYLEVLPVLSPALPGSTTCIYQALPGSTTCIYQALPGSTTCSVFNLTWKYYLYCPHTHLEILPVFSPALPGSTTGIFLSLTWKYYL